MYYKDIIKLLRAYGSENELKSFFCLKNLLFEAAAALETVIAERDETMKYIPHICETCKWWKERAKDVMCCMRPEDSGFCHFDEPDLWQWRGSPRPLNDSRRMIERREE